MRECFVVSTPVGDDNYMLDTVAYNKLNENAEWLSKAMQSLQYGFSYYKTDTQDWELNGFGANVYNENCEPVRFNKNAKLPNYREIDEKLKVEYVSCGVNLMTYHTLLDGTAHLVDTDSLSGVMFEEIIALNPQKRKKRPFSQHYDAFIAEASIYNNCTLVTNDGDLLDIVNKYFPNKAITMHELINRIEKIIS